MTILGEVRLAVPAKPASVRLVRLTAASLASRMGFTYEEVEDLRIAIDELCFVLVGTKGRPGMLVLHYSMLADGLRVTGIGDSGGTGSRSALSPLSEQILEAVVDEHEIGADGASPTFRMIKRHQET